MRGRLSESTNVPLLDVVLNGIPVTVMVNTGFTGEIAISLGTLAKVGLDVGTQVEFSKTAGGDAEFIRTRATISWFDTMREIEVLVWQKPQLGPVDGFIGVQALIGYILVIDFNEGDVVIKNPALRNEFR